MSWLTNSTPRCTGPRFSKRLGGAGYLVDTLAQRYSDSLQTWLTRRLHTKNESPRPVDLVFEAGDVGEVDECLSGRHILGQSYQD